jgi:protein-tyrosine sulfotransferase
MFERYFGSFDFESTMAACMEATPGGNPIFIGGVPRSGTTLLRVILDTHPGIHCGTELRVVQALTALWSSADRTAQPVLTDAYGVDSEHLRRIFADLVLSFLEPAWRASGKRRVAEKTPFNVLVFPELRRLFPESPLVHIIRDVRDVVASRLERDREAAGSEPLDGVAIARIRAQEWTAAMEIRRQMLAAEDLARGYFEVRYEQLVQSPQEVLEPLFAFLGERFDPGVLAFHDVPRNVAGSEEWSAAAVRRPLYESSCGRWRHSLSAGEHAVVMEVAGRELQALGYGNT